MCSWDSSAPLGKEEAEVRQEVGLGCNRSNPTHSGPLPLAPLGSTTSQAAPPAGEPSIQTRVTVPGVRGCISHPNHSHMPSRELTSRHPNCNLKNEKNPAMQKEKEEQPSRGNGVGVSYHGQWGENIFKLTHAYCFRGRKAVMFSQLIALLLRAGAIDQSLPCACPCFHGIVPL